MRRRSISLILTLLAFSAVRVAPVRGAADTLEQRVFPLNVLQDSAKFAIYVNEEPIATDSLQLAGGREIHRGHHGRPRRAKHLGVDRDRSGRRRHLAYDHDKEPPG
jgi:hypothetical protein